MSEQKYAIRFGLGAIKAVGISAMEKVCNNRDINGEFKDIFDFAKRIDPKNINKKSIEALSKSGAFDKISANRKQIFESFDIISSYSSWQADEANNNQMNFFNDLFSESKSLPTLKNTNDWSKEEKLQKEFEAFGFFLNEHPLDDFIDKLKKRGIIFSPKIEMQELDDGDIVKMAGVVATSKHRSGPKGRFAYLTISDPFGIYEIMIFDENLIGNSRDIINEGNAVWLECLVRRDDGGIRIMCRDIKALQEFIDKTPESKEYFEDIKKQSKRKYFEKNISREKRSAEVDEVSKDYNDTKNINTKNKIENFKEVRIILKNREAIYFIKSFLSNKIIAKEAEDQYSTKVFLISKNSKEDSIIELTSLYKISSLDLQKLKDNDMIDVL